MKTKVIKAELTIPTAVYSNLKPIIELEVPEHLNNTELVQYLWDTYHNIFEKPATQGQSKQSSSKIACTKCGETLRIIPAGTSKKNGKAYSQFGVCKNGCKQVEEGSLSSPEAGFSEEDELTMRDRGQRENAGVRNLSEAY